MTKKLQEEVKKLFQEKKVDLVMGYEMAGEGISTTPCFIKSEDEVERLVWNEHCIYNLSRYLIEAKDFTSSPAPKVGIVAKGCDVKSIVGLIQENQVKREALVIIGMECEKQLKVESLKFKDKEPLEKCKTCQVHTPKLYDLLIKNPQLSTMDHGPSTAVHAPGEELEAKSPEEREQYWEKEFSRCIKCYACRQVCPLCFCPQ